MEHAHDIKPTDPKSKILASNFIDGIQNSYIKNKTLTICLHYIELLLKKIRDKRSENLTLAKALPKVQYNVTSMQLTLWLLRLVPYYLLSSAEH